MQIQGQDSRDYQMGSDGSKMSSSNGTFHIADSKEKGELSRGPAESASAAAQLQYHS
jgi:hypothetical protein